MSKIVQESMITLFFYYHFLFLNSLGFLFFSSCHLGDDMLPETVLGNEFSNDWTPFCAGYF